jgi:hypothetical protein
MSITSVLGKRERPPYAKHYYPSGPGAMPNVPNRPSGPQRPPSLSGLIPAQSRSTVKYLETNPTGSIPLMIRPWAEHYEKDYAPGCLIFCKQEKKGRSPLITCADVPTLNYLFADGVVHPEVGLKAEDYEFFGVFRNDAGKQVDHLGFPRYTNPKQRLIQCDVYGRAKVANFWGKKVRTGQRIGMALVWKRISTLKQPNRHARTLPQSTTVLQLIPTVNECKPETDIELKKQGLAQPRQIDHYVKKWHIGVVSQAAFEPPTKGKIALALHDSQQRTDLPQIEILMI